MIIYNVTIKVDPSIAEQWLDWMRSEHIPAMMATGCFERAVVLKLLELDESEGPTYAFQYTAKDKEVYDHYLDTYSVRMRNESFARWGDKFIAFRSVMEVVN
jgi:hypothetical protein